jgi:hypothetical protein
MQIDKLEGPIIQQSRTDNPFELKPNKTLEFTFSSIDELHSQADISYMVGLCAVLEYENNVVAGPFIADLRLIKLLTTGWSAEDISFPGDKLIFRYQLWIVHL